MDPSTSYFECSKVELFNNMEPESYEKFYEEFGAILKIGIHTDFENKTKIADLARFKTTKSDGKWISLKIICSM